MSICLFATDLHGRVGLYDKLVETIISERPSSVFLGGDLLPHFGGQNFVCKRLIPIFEDVRRILRAAYPDVFLILGNDDPRCEEADILEGERERIWHYVHGRQVPFGEFSVCGYACVPPTPFRLKDWERYDVSRYVDPGCLSPEEGSHTVPVDESDVRWGTIESDLAALSANRSLARSIFLFHSPPHHTSLDHAALDGKTYEHVPLDVHVGSVAIRRFIEKRQPLLTLHGHIHESARISGVWKIAIGSTVCISAAHDGPELALVRFDPENPADASRELL